MSNVVSVDFAARRAAIDVLRCRACLARVHRAHVELHRRYNCLPFHELHQPPLTAGEGWWGGVYADDGTVLRDGVTVGRWKPVRP